MPNSRIDDKFRDVVSQAGNSNLELKAPSRLKARLYSALIREQQATGPLQSLSHTEAEGRGLCVFEKLVQIAPAGERAQTPFFCWACHARILAEKIEGAPVYWLNCPYANFQK
jgi:hypothetical protein